MSTIHYMSDRHRTITLQCRWQHTHNQQMLLHAPAECAEESDCIQLYSFRQTDTQPHWHSGSSPTSSPVDYASSQFALSSQVTKPCIKSSKKAWYAAAHGAVECAAQTSLPSMLHLSLDKRHDHAVCATRNSLSVATAAGQKIYRTGLFPCHCSWLRNLQSNMLQDRGCLYLKQCSQPSVAL